MKRTLSFLLPAAAMLLAACGGANDRPSFPDFQEMADPAAAFADWSAAGDTPCASFVTTDRRFGKSQLPDVEPRTACRLTAWRGERVSAQLLVWSAQPVERLVCTAGVLTSDEGRLPESAVRTRFVRYVMSDEFACGCCKRKPQDFAAVLTADMLDERPSMALEACTVRPVWITVDVPQDAAPGLYRTPVTVACDGDEQRLELAVEVTGRTLPAPSEWRYHLDLWQHPAAVARVEGTEMWSDAHFEALRPVMKPLADAGQKVVTATLNKDPWNNQCYDAYADMIVWTRLADGTWEYDFTVFDRWVRFMLDLGVGKYVNCYSMLPWNNMLHYKDAVTGEFVDVKADPGTPAFREMWGPFLPAFVGHLREKGWLGITNIAMDERSPEVMAAVTALLKEVAPELGIALADNHKIFKQYPYIKDMCASIFGPIEQTDIVQRRSKGLTTTFYVCCSSGFPNTYTSSAPAEATYLSWYAAAEDYDGFLRWVYNSWVEDPIRDSRFRKWAAGDTYLVYPEGRSSIRFERLVEGIQDWEKIRLLKTEFSGDDAKLQTLHDLLEPFRSSVAFDGWEQTLRNARATLNTL